MEVACTSPSHLTEAGIPGFTHIPFGAHLCHFYTSRQDLVDIIVPYLRSGLRNRERCIWITTPSLTAAEARAELARRMVSYDRLCAAGRLRVIDRDAWLEGPRNGDECDSWLRAEESALADGCTGLRIAGHLSCMDDWSACMNTEATASTALQSRRIVALCGYDGRRCGWRQVCDVIRSHHDALHRSHGAWHLLQRPGGTYAAAAEVLRSFLGAPASRGHQAGC